MNSACNSSYVAESVATIAYLDGCPINEGDQNILQIGESGERGSWHVQGAFQWGTMLFAMAYKATTYVRHVHLLNPLDKMSHTPSLFLAVKVQPLDKAFDLFHLVSLSVLKTSCFWNCISLYSL